MAKSMEDIKKEVEALKEIASENTYTPQNMDKLLSVLIIARSFDNLADAIREAGKEIADNLIHIG